MSDMRDASVGSYPHWVHRTNEAGWKESKNSARTVVARAEVQMQVGKVYGGKGALGLVAEAAGI